LSAEIHGEWTKKAGTQAGAARRQTNVRKETNCFGEYARQSFEDTLTLYLHGTCCDIDVETGTAPNAGAVFTAQAWNLC